MQVTRFGEAHRYDAPNHFDMRSLRLQGMEVSDADFAWVGLSHFLPGGGASMDAGTTGKIYVVLAGRVAIELDDGSVNILDRLDSCFIPAGESRAIRNEENEVATMLVIMPQPPRPVA